MPLNLPNGSACCVDANIFYYHFVDTPPFSDHCSDLLDRVSRGRVLAYTSVHLLAETIHKVMLAEAASTFGLTRANLVGWLKQHSDRISQLARFVGAAHELGTMPLRILPLDAASVATMAGVSHRLKLLTNDALTVALMERHGLVHLVTNDDDFDGVSGLTIWKPR